MAEPPGFPELIMGNQHAETSGSHISLGKIPDDKNLQGIDD
jgi:hypothetical protein